MVEKVKIRGILVGLFVFLSGFIGSSNGVPCCNKNPLLPLPTQPPIVPILRPTLIPTNFTQAGCENSNLVITCPSSQQIYVFDAFYGSLGQVSTCTFGGASPNTCYADATAVVQAQCNGKISCSVPANNGLLPGGDPCPGTYKYLKANYTCYSCQRIPENNNFLIQCPAGSQIVINKASWYGLLNPLACFPNQCSANVTTTVATICENQNTCAVNGTTTLFGDPCPGEDKYLAVDYSCQSVSGLLQSSACENSNLAISCPSGTTISIQDGFYGSLGPVSGCTFGGTQKYTCYANATATLQAQCNGQTSCSVGANNGLYGDPCGGTYKYLKANYKCI